MPLYLVPTPIGNLEDITLRALRVLREADLIACEDTRTSRVLLAKYDIHVPLTSFHLHNENEKISYMLGKLRVGEKVALISDAGTPGISDPGWILLKHAIDEGIHVDVLPGACALLPGLLLSGINPVKFMFVGFPPDKSGERVKLFRSIKNLSCTLCFYVSPHKIDRYLADMLEVFGNRRAALVREISKVFQEAIRDDLEGISARVKDGIKGELVLIIEGCSENNDETKILWQTEASAMHDDGASVKDIVKVIAEEYNAPKNEVKRFLQSRLYNNSRS